MIRKIFAFIAILALSSCIGVRSYKIKEISQSEMKVNLEKKANVFLKWGYDSNNLSYAGQKFQMADNHKKLLLEVFNKTKCCIFVNKENEADIIVDGRFKDETDPIIFVFASLTGFTFGIIPSWGNAKIRIITNVTKDRNSYKYDIDDSMLIATWLPFAFIAPFSKSAIKKESEMNENLYKNLFFRMNNDGVFKLKTSK